LPPKWRVKIFKKLFRKKSRGEVWLEMGGKDALFNLPFRIIYNFHDACRGVTVSEIEKLQKKKN